MKRKPNPHTHYRICSVCGGYAPEFNEDLRGKRYCQTCWRALPAEKRTVGPLPPVARDRDGNLVRYPGGLTPEECEEIRQSGWKPTSQVRDAKPSREERQSAERRAASVELATERLA